MEKIDLYAGLYVLSLAIMALCTLVYQRRFYCNRCRSMGMDPLTGLCIDCDEETIAAGLEGGEARG